MAQGPGVAVARQMSTVSATVAVTWHCAQLLFYILLCQLFVIIIIIIIIIIIASIRIYWSAGSLAEPARPSVKTIVIGK